MMKVMIISDTHSHEENLEKILQEEGMPDHLIHLGDSEKGEHAIRNLVTCPLHMVAGNCDFFSNLPKTQIIEIDGQRILITHGHYYYVSVGTRDGGGESEPLHDRDVRTHTQAIRGSERSGADGVESGKPFVSASGGAPPKLHYNGSGRK